MQDQESGEVCSVCKEPVKGGFNVLDTEAVDGEKMIIAIVDTPDRDFNDCDACNTRVHFRCSQHPASGYCDRCFDKYGLEEPSPHAGWPGRE
jgi:hypothetical protein